MTSRGKVRGGNGFGAYAPKLQISVYFTGSYSSRAARSGRCDVKSRARPGDIEPLRDRNSPECTLFSGEVSVLSPLGMRGVQIDLPLTCCCSPRFAISRWPIGAYHMAVAARPSPPYRDWARWNAHPLTWRKDAHRIDPSLDSILPRWGPDDAISSASQPTP